MSDGRGTSGQGREEDAANVYGCTNTLDTGHTGHTRHTSQGTSGQARGEDAASLYKCTGTLAHYAQTVRETPGVGRRARGRQRKSKGGGNGTGIFIFAPGERTLREISFVVGWRETKRQGRGRGDGVGTVDEWGCVPARHGGLARRGVLGAGPLLGRRVVEGILLLLGILGCDVESIAVVVFGSGSTALGVRLRGGGHGLARGLGGAAPRGAARGGDRGSFGVGGGGAELEPALDRALEGRGGHDSGGIGRLRLGLPTRRALARRRRRERARRSISRRLADDGRGLGRRLTAALGWALGDHRYGWMSNEKTRPTTISGEQVNEIWTRRVRGNPAACGASEGEP